MATMWINFDVLPIRLLKGGAEAGPPLMLADRLCVPRLKTPHY
jgi:hypothetical protein